MNANKLKLGVAAAAVAAAVGGAYATGYAQAPAAQVANAATPATLPISAPAPTTGAQLPDMSGIVARNGAAVVNISVSGSRKAGAAMEGMPQLDEDHPLNEFFRRYRGGPRGEAPVRGMGSGFIVSADGVVLTNAHVVDGADEVTVKLTDKREFKAKVLGADKTSDVAVLKIDAKELPTVKIGNPAQTRVGDWVLAIGSPFGFENTVTAGVVSAKGRSLPDDSSVPFIQSDVAVNPGNSGGPLFNAQGQVVGINSQIYSRSGGFMGVSFSIPIELAMHIEQQIVAHGKVEHAQLGVTIQQVNQDFADSFKLPKPEGALVAQVTKGSAADKAGLKPGDVILSANGQTIVDSGDLPASIALAKPGEKLHMNIWRDGHNDEITATLQGTKASGDETAQSGQADGGKLGLALRPLQPQEQREAHVKGGLLIEQAAGAAAAAGVQQGDVLMAINGQPATSVDQVRDVLKKSGKSVALLIQRDGQQLFVPVPLG